MMIEIDGEVYALDLNKINDFVFSSQKNPNIETNISESYSINDNDNALELMNKSINENKIYGNSSVDNIKYDLVRKLLDILLGVNNEIQSPIYAEQVFENRKVDTLDNMSLGEIISFNTFLNEGFLINLK